MRRCPRCKAEVSVADFASSGYCKPCNRARSREWADAHPEKKKAQRAKFREQHRTKLNAEALARYHRIMAGDPESIRKLRRDYVKTEKGVIYNRMARHKRRGASPDALAREWAAIVLRDPCAYCGEPAVELDHIQPLALAGTGTWENLAGACRECNARKNDQPLLAFVAA